MERRNENQHRLCKIIAAANNQLRDRGFRLLTTEEEGTVFCYLREVVRTFPEDEIGGFDLMEILALESVKRTAELHPDMLQPTPERVEQAIDKMIMG